MRLVKISMVKINTFKIKKSKSPTPTKSDLQQKQKAKVEKIKQKEGVLAKPSKYLDFVLFIALPPEQQKEMTGCETQKQFAAKIGVHQDSLVDWKKKPEFWDDVSRVRKEIFKEYISEVVYALKKTAVKTGAASEVKVFLEYAGELKKDSDPSKLPEAMEKIILKVSEILR